MKEDILATEYWLEAFYKYWKRDQDNHKVRPQDLNEMDRKLVKELMDKFPEIRMSLRFIRYKTNEPEASE